jgi:hypothetical protein
MVTESAKRSKALRSVRSWMAQVADPVWAIRGISSYWRYFGDWYRYARKCKGGRIRLVHAYPQVHDQKATTPIDAHYSYANGWAMRRIVSTQPPSNVDVRSDAMFANLLAGVVPLVFVDYRPLEARIAGLNCLGRSLLGLRPSGIAAKTPKSTKTKTKYMPPSDHPWKRTFLLCVDNHNLLSGHYPVASVTCLHAITRCPSASTGWLKLVRAVIIPGFPTSSQAGFSASGAIETQV